MLVNMRLAEGTAGACVHLIASMELRERLFQYCSMIRVYARFRPVTIVCTRKLRVGEHLKPGWRIRHLTLHDMRHTKVRSLATGDRCWRTLGQVVACFSGATMSTLSAHVIRVAQWAASKARNQSLTGRTFRQTARTSTS
jgi:hypothetical protein